MAGAQRHQHDKQHLYTSGFLQYGVFGECHRQYLPRKHQSIRNWAKKKNSLKSFDPKLFYDGVPMVGLEQTSSVTTSRKAQISSRKSNVFMMDSHRKQDAVTECCVRKCVKKCVIFRAAAVRRMCRLQPALWLPRRRSGRGSRCRRCPCSGCGRQGLSPCPQGAP